MGSHRTKVYRAEGLKKALILLLLLHLKFISVHLQITEEGSTVSCVVERTRGALDYVHVFYTISQIESEGINYLVDDFANASGTITFLPWQRSEVNSMACVSSDASGKVVHLFIYSLINNSLVFMHFKLCGKLGVSIIL